MFASLRQSALKFISSNPFFLEKYYFLPQNLTLQDKLTYIGPVPPLQPFFSNSTSHPLKKHHVYSPCKPSILTTKHSHHFHPTPFKLKITFVIIVHIHLKQTPKVTGRKISTNFIHLLTPSLKILH